jgi:hypothetical protein
MFRLRKCRAHAESIRQAAEFLPGKTYTRISLLACVVVLIDLLDESSSKLHHDALAVLDEQVGQHIGVAPL